MGGRLAGSSLIASPLKKIGQWEGEVPGSCRNTIGYFRFFHWTRDGDMEREEEEKRSRWCGGGMEEERIRGSRKRFRRVEKRKRRDGRDMEEERIRGRRKRFRREEDKKKKRGGDGRGMEEERIRESRKRFIIAKK